MEELDYMTRGAIARLIVTGGFNTNLPLAIRPITLYVVIKAMVEDSGLVPGHQVIEMTNIIADMFSPNLVEGIIDEVREVRITNG